MPRDAHKLQNARLAARRFSPVLPAFFWEYRRFKPSFSWIAGKLRVPGPSLKIHIGPASCFRSLCHLPGACHMFGIPGRFSLRPGQVKSSDYGLPSTPTFYVQLWILQGHRTMLSSRLPPGLVLQLPGGFFLLPVLPQWSCPVSPSLSQFSLCTFCLCAGTYLLNMVLCLPPVQTASVGMVVGPSTLLFCPGCLGISSVSLSAFKSLFVPGA